MSPVQPDVGFRQLVQVFEQKSALVRCKVLMVSLAWRRGDRRERNSMDLVR